jgi:addiction module HigA family antidote
MTVEQAADGLGMSADDLGGIIHGTADLTAETAVRLSHYFETSREFWLNLQRSYDLSMH